MNKDKDKYRVYCREANGYVEDMMQFYLCSSGNLWFFDGTPRLCDSKRFQVEKCIGRKDCEGKLVYEGDIVRTERFMDSEIIWDNEFAQFLLGDINFLDAELGEVFSDESELEIVGTIHDSKGEIK